MSSKKCLRCKKFYNPNETLLFKHHGFILKSSHSIVCPDCTKTEMQSDLDKSLDIIMLDSQQNPVVDWPKLLSLEEYSEKRLAILKTLVNLGIVSYKPCGHWFISDYRLILNPDLNGIILFFTSEKMIRDYAKARHSNTLYPWDIMHVDVAIPKSRII